MGEDGIARYACGSYAFDCYSVCVLACASVCCCVHCCFSLCLICCLVLHEDWCFSFCLIYFFFTYLQTVAGRSDWM
jgi:hypothetical protein